MAGVRETTAEEPSAAARPSALAAGSWALYDFANTIYSMNVTSLYFALWVTVDHGGEDILYSAASSLSMLLMAVASPLLGAVSDQVGRRLPFLAFFTTLCVVSTAAIGVAGNLWAGLVFFVVANSAYQSGLIYYDALLPEVSTERTRGRVSGAGVALGYAGAIAGILAVGPFVEAGGRVASFVPTAALFAVFAVPCFLFVRERARDGAKDALAMLFSGEAWRRATNQTLSTLRHAQRYPGLARFLVARFFYTDAVNTVIAFMSVYAVRVGGFSDSELRLLLVVSTSFAVAGSFVYGFLADRFGPKRTLNIVLTQWAAALALAVVAPNKELFWLVGALAGISMGSTWVCDRVFLLRLSPPQYVGEFFGLYGLAGKFSSIVGPMVWGAIVLALSAYEVTKYRVAVASLLVLLLAGFALLQGVSDHRRTWENEGRR
jgi:UMF1 family MFS transporter